MDTILPDWLENGVESSLRDTEEEAVPPQPAMPIAPSSAQQLSKGVASPMALTPRGGSPAGSNVKNEGSKGPWTDLDKFYADTEEVEEDEDQEEDDDEEDESEEEEDEDESEEDGGQYHSDGGEEPENGDDQDHVLEEDVERGMHESRSLMQHLERPS